LIFAEIILLYIIDYETVFLRVLKVCEVCVTDLCSICFAYVLGSSGTDNIVWAYMGPILSATFSALWVLPLFVLSKVVNGFWFQARAVFFYLICL